MWQQTEKGPMHRGGGWEEGNANSADGVYIAGKHRAQVLPTWQFSLALRYLLHDRKEREKKRKVPRKEV